MNIRIYKMYFSIFSRKRSEPFAARLGHCHHFNMKIALWFYLFSLMLSCDCFVPQQFVKFRLRGKIVLCKSANEKPAKPRPGMKGYYGNALASIINLAPFLMKTSCNLLLSSSFSCN